MSNFDLSEALESPLDWTAEKTEDKSCCSDMECDPDEIFKLNVDLELVVSQNPLPMHRVVSLLLRANKIKKYLQRKGRGLSDDQLCTMIMNSIEKTVVERVGTSSFPSGRRITLNRLRSWECFLTDREKKDIVCTAASTPVELCAATLKGGNHSHKVTFKMASYSGSEMTVALSLIKQKLYISCTMIDDKAVLRLEECDEEDLKAISNESDMERFLFHVKGVDGTRFESVKCRGWFISTSYEKELQPLEMCQVDAVNRETAFSMK
ncbi:interleukin-1 beta-like [Solea senegalensis]|uniref:Interleukin-1 beta-like n=2 Tax=Solea senegalensis TaxID=28829 RepID=A0AAV6R059_SOLSE|nr:uncharacterized protein LOC122758740 isoform X1 [Solea senegalensis]KAG7498575.1 interleukin-1 beta-like [Solea senegalensis]